MKNNTNIYDIDGELVRKADDNHQWTLEEAQNRIKIYSEKLKNLQENDPKNPKIQVYTTYLRNINGYIYKLYSQMSPNELKTIFEAHKTDNEDLNKQIEKAINELKESVDDGETTEDTKDEVLRTTTGDTESNTNEESGDVEVIERGLSDVHEKRGITQSDLLVERDNVVNVMDEYVSPIGEASDEYVDYEEVD